MENQKHDTPEQPDYRKKLVEALRETLDMCLNTATIEYSEIPDKLVGMVIHEGWMPPKLDEEWPEVIQVQIPDGGGFFDITDALVESHMDERGRALQEIFGHHMDTQLGKSTPVVIVPDEWRVLEGLPTKSLEISQSGAIRNAKTGRIFLAEYDIDFNCYVVKLTINGEDFWLNGEIIAKQMWG